MRTWVGAASALVAAVLVTTGCSAPLEPESRSEPSDASRPTASEPSATPPATSATPTPSPGVTVPPDLKNTLEDAAKRQDREILGADASWPQCPRGMGIPEKRSFGAPMPLPQARFVILGLTNGPGFTPNPCLADQVAWVKERRLMAAAYSVISWPDAATRRRYGSLEEAGYQQARFNLATMQRAGLTSPVIWIDVEPVPKFDWSRDTRANAEVVEGAARGYREAGYAIGAYSTQHLWEVVVGDLRLGIPEWRAAGQTSRAEARKRCGRSYAYQGGPAVLSQWVEADRDQNITCPGTALAMSRWFHQY